MMLTCTEEEKELPDGSKDQPRGAAGEEAIDAPALLSQIIPNSLIPGGDFFEGRIGSIRL